VVERKRWDEVALRVDGELDILTAGSSRPSSITSSATVQDTSFWTCAR
jgi:hypothetical protein